MAIFGYYVMSVDSNTFVLELFGRRYGPFSACAANGVLQSKTVSYRYREGGCQSVTFLRYDLSVSEHVFLEHKTWVRSEK